MSYSRHAPCSDGSTVGRAVEANTDAGGRLTVATVSLRERPRLPPTSGSHE